MLRLKGQCVGTWRPQRGWLQGSRHGCWPGAQEEAQLGVPASSGHSLLAPKFVCQAQERRPVPSVLGSPSFCQPLYGSLGAVKAP